MAIGTPVLTTGVFSSATSATVSGSAGLGSALLVYIYWSTGAGAQTITQSGTVWTALDGSSGTNDGASNGVEWVGYIRNYAGGAFSTTFTEGGASGKDGGWIVVELPGADTSSSPLRFTPAASNFTTLHLFSNSATGITATNDALVGFFGYSNSAAPALNADATSNPSTGWSTSALKTGNSANTPHGHAWCMYQVLGGVGSNNLPITNPVAAANTTGAVNVSGRGILIAVKAAPTIGYPTLTPAGFTFPVALPTPSPAAWPQVTPGGYTFPVDLSAPAVVAYPEVTPDATFVFPFLAGGAPSGTTNTLTVNDTPLVLSESVSFVGSQTTTDPTLVLDDSASTLSGSSSITENALTLAELLSGAASSSTTDSLLVADSVSDVGASTMTDPALTLTESVSASSPLTINDTPLVVADALTLGGVFALTDDPTALSVSDALTLVGALSPPSIALSLAGEALTLASLFAWIDPALATSDTLAELALLTLTDPALVFSELVTITPITVVAQPPILTTVHARSGVTTLATRTGVTTVHARDGSSVVIGRKPITTVHARDASTTLERVR